MSLHTARSGQKDGSHAPARRSTVDGSSGEHPTLTSAHETIRRGSLDSNTVRRGTGIASSNLSRKRTTSASASSTAGTSPRLTLESVSETALAAQREIAFLKEAHAEEVETMRSEIARLEERIGSFEGEITGLHGLIDRGQERTVEQIGEVTNSMSLFHSAVGTCREELAAARNALTRERELAAEKTNQLTNNYSDFQQHSNTLMNKIQSDNRLFEEQVKTHKCQLEYMSNQLSGLQKEVNLTNNMVTLLKQEPDRPIRGVRSKVESQTRLVPAEQLSLFSTNAISSKQLPAQQLPMQVPTPQMQTQNVITGARSQPLVFGNEVNQGIQGSLVDAGSMATTGDFGVVIPPTPQPVAGRTIPASMIDGPWTMSRVGGGSPPTTPGPPGSPRLQGGQVPPLQQPQQRASPSFSPSLPTQSPRNGYAPVTPVTAGVRGMFPP